MNDRPGGVFVYLLIDNSLLDEVSASYVEEDPDRRPSWLAPVYPEHALAASPFVVDVEAAYEVGDLDQVMGYLNARRPALHVSIIETGLELEPIVQHLRRFIFILSPDEKQYTLRYADCAVLRPLSSLLSAEQWAAMRGPITRWCIHDRSGAVIQLPSAEPVANAPTPLCLSHDQMSALDEASEPDHYVAKVKIMHNGAALPGDTAEQHAWAHAARQEWRAANSSNSLVLLFLTEAALVTRGDILRRPELQEWLAIDEASTFRNKLQALVGDIRERRYTVPHTTAGNEELNLDIIF